jgi:hypothetical protein
VKIAGIYDSKESMGCACFTWDFGGLTLFLVIFISFVYCVYVCMCICVYVCMYVNLHGDWRVRWLPNMWEKSSLKKRQSVVVFIMILFDPGFDVWCVLCGVVYDAMYVMRWRDESNCQKHILIPPLSLYFFTSPSPHSSLYIPSSTSPSPHQLPVRFRWQR